MTIQDWGAIGEIGGALLVGFTLIYLAIQLRQNTVSVETSALSGWITARIAINEAFSKLDGATVHEGMRDSRRLTESDSVAFGLMFQTYMMHGQVTHLLFKRGPAGPTFGWTAEKDYVPLAEALGQTGPREPQA